jgi:hypothetical protein
MVPDSCRDGRVRSVAHACLRSKALAAHRCIERSPTRALLMSSSSRAAKHVSHSGTGPTCTPTRPQRVRWEWVRRAWGAAYCQVCLLPEPETSKPVQTVARATHSHFNTIYLLPARSPNACIASHALHRGAVNSSGQLQALSRCMCIRSAPPQAVTRLPSPHACYLRQRTPTPASAHQMRSLEVKLPNVCKLACLARQRTVHVLHRDMDISQHAISRAVAALSPS